MHSCRDYLVKASVNQLASSTSHRFTSCRAPRPTAIIDE
ncbi:hypothetical protein I552_5452 [Mycobacterium xenopi 3993]|nr:hypothetical protein I552_5452 [Mycobacterium xenopi 3993]